MLLKSCNYPDYEDTKNVKSDLAPFGYLEYWMIRVHPVKLSLLPSLYPQAVHTFVCQSVPYLALYSAWSLSPRYTPGFLLLLSPGARSRFPPRSDLLTVHPFTPKPEPWSLPQTFCITRFRRPNWTASVTETRMRFTLQKIFTYLTTDTVISLENDWWQILMIFLFYCLWLINRCGVSLLRLQ